MKHNIGVIRQTRSFILQAIEDLSTDQLNHIPEGFNNNIIWNLGHMIAAQQGVCYMRNGMPPRISEEFFNRYKPGSKPEQNISAEEVAVIKELTFSTLDQLEADYENGHWTGYKPWTTRYGVELTSIEDAVQFILFHEGLHGGVIASLKRLVPSEGA